MRWVVLAVLTLFSFLPRDAVVVGNEPIENIEIEFKKASGPAVLMKPTDSSHIPPAQQEVVPVEQEGHHHVLFENQYARVLDVAIPAGETTLFHTHAHDNISIRISGGQIQTQFKDREWQQSTVKPGAVVFSDGSKKSLYPPHPKPWRFHVSSCRRRAATVRARMNEALQWLA
jgi:quercetin dioxygenase-like cupin family protein